MNCCRTKKKITIIYINMLKILFIGILIEFIVITVHGCIYIFIFTQKCTQWLLLHNIPWNISNSGRKHIYFSGSLLTKRYKLLQENINSEESDL